MSTFKVQTIEPRTAAVVRAEVPMNEVRSAFDSGFGEVFGTLQAQGLTMTGAPFGFYPRMPTETVEVVVGVPVAAPVAPQGSVESFELPGGEVVTGLHTGPYEGLAATYQALSDWAATQGIALGTAMWEVYLTDPGSQPDPSLWQTEIFWPKAPRQERAPTVN